MNIQFFTEDTNYKFHKKRLIREWIKKTIRDHGFLISQLNYIFCSDLYLLEINRKHLNHDYYTDIITFDNSDEEKMIESDVFVSIDRVNENAAKEKISFELELYRVIIHGVFHLLGYDDKVDEQKKEMRKKENEYLSLLQNKCSTWNMREKNS